MPVFRRRRSDDESTDAAVVDGAEVTEDTEVIEGAERDTDTAADVPATPLPARADGPFDATELAEDVEGLDLGSLLVRPAEGVEVRVEVDEATGVIQAVTLVVGESVLQVGIFAAPRTEGIWAEVRGEIAKSITAGGGTVDFLEGDLGPELRARVVGADEKGNQVTQPVRFLGVDGPRWFLRGLLSGPAVDNAGLAAPLLESFTQLVVVRGTDPMAPHEPLPLHLPTVVSGEEDPDEVARHDLNPFRRGPEITEIR